MNEKCEICGNNLVKESGKKPEWILITGFCGDFAASIDVCNQCFLNRPEEIYKKLIEMEYE